MRTGQGTQVHPGDEACQQSLRREGCPRPRHLLSQSEGGGAESDAKVKTRVIRSISLGGRISTPIPNADIPGPGTYTLQDLRVGVMTAVRMEPPTRNDSFSRYRTASPGPAAYAVIREFARNHGPKFTYFFC